MLRKNEKHKDLPEEFHQTANYITKLMDVIDGTIKRGYYARYTPYFKTNQVCYIYWPRIEYRLRVYKNYLGNIIGYPKPYEPTRAYHRDLRQYTESLLGPLLVPVGEDIFDFAARQNCHPRSEECFSLVDVDNYTAFQYLKPCISYALRPQIFPPMDPTTIDWLNDVPEPLQLLYQAWSTLRMRCSENLFSFEDKGLGFTSQGFLFIHWERFLCTTSIKWRKEPFSVQEIHDHLCRYKEPIKISQHMLLRNLAMPDGYSLVDAVTKQRTRNRYLQTLYEMGLGHSATSFCTYCTIIDPVGLYRRKDLFNGCAYSRRRQRARKTYADFDLRCKQGLPPKRTEKLYSFEFSPSRFLKEPLDVTAKLPDHQWFDDQHSETIYAIKRAGVFYFTRPNYLSTARDAACSADVQVWLRALDSLKMVMDVSESGEWDLSAKSIAMPRSDYLDALTKQLRVEAGKTFIVDFVNRTDPVSPLGKPVSGREFDKAMQHYMAQEQRGESYLGDATARSGHWYNKLVAKVAREKINPSLVRREAYVHPPGYESPTRVQFYAPMAIRAFKQFAEASFGIIEFKYQQTPLCPLLTHNSHPAPYILAWARFCLDIAEKYYDTTSRRERQTHHWAPAEDIILATTYRSRPRLTDEQWSELLAQLPLRTKVTCRTRTILNNKLLKTILLSQRYDTHCFGSHGRTLTQARRIVFLLGCAHADLRRGKTVNKQSSFVKKIFDAGDEQVNQWLLPDTYNTHHFTSFLQPY